MNLGIQPLKETCLASGRKYDPSPFHFFILHEWKNYIFMHEIILFQEWILF